MAALPPATTGQPTPCPSAVSRRPKAEVNGAVSGSMECAAAPASRARAASVLKRRAVCSTDGVPTERETGQRQRVAWKAAHRPEDVGHDAIEPVHQRPHEMPVGHGVPAEVGGRLVDPPVQRGGPPAAERMGERHLGLAQHDPEPGEVERAKERGGHQRWMHRRAHVVTEAVEGQGLGAGATPDRRLPLEDLHADAGPGQRESGGQAVGS